MLYMQEKKIKDRGATSGLCYAGNVIKNTSFMCRDDIWLSIPEQVTLDDSGLSDENECWRIAIRFTIPDVTTDQRLFGVVATPCPGVVIGVLNGHLNYWLSSDGANWDIANRTVGSYTLVAGSTYTIHFKRYNVDNVPFYKCSIRPDGGDWTTDIDINNTTPIKSGFYYNLGRDWSIFSNSITYHLDSDTYITKWNVRGREQRIWSSNIEGVVPVHGIKTAYIGSCVVPSGNVTINNNIVSNFTDTAHVYTNKITTLNTASTWDIIVKATTGSDISSQQYVVLGQGTTARDFVIFLQNNKLTWQLSSNGTDYDIVNRNTSFTVSPNTTYWFRLQFTGSAYALSYSTDGDKFTLADRIESTAKVVSNTFHRFGCVIGATDWYWRGSMDFGDSNIWCKIDGQVVWDKNTAEVQKVYNLQSYNPQQVLGEIANPQDAASQWFYVDIYRPGVYKLWLVGGGNTTNWCYIGCNYPGSAAGFIGKMYFNTKCHLRVGVGLQDEYSRLQVASWEDTNTWYGLVLCEPGTDASGGAGRGGYVTVNRDSTFNNYFDIELETNGNNGSNSGYPASVYGGYGTKDINGYGKLEYIRENQ